MKAVVFHGLGDIRLDDVREPKIEQPADAIVGLTASAICGTDLHMVRGTMAGTILGHEGVGIIEEIGPSMRDFKIGDRVVVPSTICCRHCWYGTRGYQSRAIARYVLFRIALSKDSYHFSRPCVVCSSSQPSRASCFLAGSVLCTGGC
jgi:threonine dehydrogenase-like Zn-dependent dehydrogenase